jgi:hypothetical protein
LHLIWEVIVSPEEAELIKQLRVVYQEYQELSRNINLAAQRRKFMKGPEDLAEAEQEEQRWLKEINRLMDRMRAIEGALLKVRGKLRPLAR